MKTKKNSKLVETSDSELLNRTAQQVESKTELLKIDVAARLYNRGLPTERVLRLLQSKAPRFWELAEVVGKWVWIRFDDKQPPTITAELSELGLGCLESGESRRAKNGVEHEPRRPKR